MKKRIVAVVLLFLILFGASYYAQEILKAKFMGDATTIVDGFYAEKKDALDVVFIGSSNCFCTIDPLVLYKNYGITGYNFASSSQTISISKLYAKETFKKQRPKVIALEVNYIPGTNVNDVSESSLRWGLTQIPFSFDKLKCLKESDITFGPDYISYVFPILRYHERWKEVTKNDFVYHMKDKMNHDKGFLRTDDVGENVNLSDYNLEGESWLEEDMIGSLDEFLEICKKNGANVVFFKSPKMEWYAYQTKVVRDYADAKGIPFIDFNEKIDELCVDVNSDFRDGHHLNSQGAYKITDYFGRFLKENYELEDHRLDDKGSSFEQALYYYNRLLPQPFMEATSIMECNELISQQKDYIMVVTYRGGVNAKTKEKVLPHQWVYVDNKLLFDQEWKEDGVVVRDVDDIQMVLQKKKRDMQVIFDNMNYPGQQNNWAVIIYDKLQKKVVADLGFDS